MRISPLRTGGAQTGLAAAILFGAGTLNAEGVFTTLLAWFVFRENFDRRIALGMVAIVAGAVVPSIPTGTDFGTVWPSLASLGPCLCRGIDDNLIRKITLTDASWLAVVRDGVAGPVNLAIAFSLGATLPPVIGLAASMVAGFFASG